MLNKIFSLDVKNVSVEDVNDGDFLKLDLQAISDGVNRNDSEFLRESFEPSIKTIYNKPILAYFNPQMGDVEEHNSRLNVDMFGDTYYDYEYDKAEKPVGVIPESATIDIVNIDNKNWVVIKNAYVWTGYNKRLTDLIKKQISKKVSVEIEVIDSYMDGEIERIKLWKFLGITILGKDENGMAIEEGISGANLKLSEYTNSNEFNSYKKKFAFALYNKIDILSKYGVSENSTKGANTMEVFISKKDYGTGDAISLDKSSDSVSNDSWGKVSKTELRNEVLKAKNYKTLVKSVYLDVEDGWEDSPSSKLKYPVMQYKDGKFVYNAAGLLSAQQYGEKYDEGVAKKALSLRKKLGLVKKEKEEKMKKFIEKAKDSGFAFLGIFNGKLTFVKEEMAEESCDMKEKEELSVFEVEKCEAEKFAECDDDEKEFAWDELTGKSVKMAEEDDSDDEEDDKEDEEDEEEKKEMAARCSKLEKEKKELAARCEEAEKELKDIRMKKFEEDTDAILSDEDEDMDEKDKEYLKKMREEDKFGCDVEKFEKELAFRKYSKSKQNKKSENSAKLSFSVFKPENKNTKVADEFDELDKI